MVALDGEVNMLFCKEPDEYCGITSNNLFANVMVRRKLSLAARASERLEKEDPEQYAPLGLSAGELREAIPIPRDPETGRLRQDDSLHLAGLGETWQTLIFGFAGLHLTPDGPALAPHLPAKWRSLSFRFIHRGKHYRALIYGDGAVVFGAL